MIFSQSATLTANSIIESYLPSCSYLDYALITILLVSFIILEIVMEHKK